MSRRLVLGVVWVWAVCVLALLGARAVGHVHSTASLADLVRLDLRPGDRGWCWREICVGWTTGKESRRLAAQFPHTGQAAQHRLMSGGTISGIGYRTGMAGVETSYFVGSVDMLSSYPQTMIDAQPVTIVLLEAVQSNLMLGDVVRAFGVPATTDSYCVVTMNGVSRCEIHVCTTDNLCVTYRTQSRRLSLHQPVDSILIFVRGVRPVLSEFYPPLRRLWRGFGKLPLGR